MKHAEYFVTITGQGYGKAPLGIYVRGCLADQCVEETVRYCDLEGVKGLLRHYMTKSNMKKTVRLLNSTTTVRVTLSSLVPGRITIARSAFTKN